jgi:hypothetical protein
VAWHGTVFPLCAVTAVVSVLSVLAARSPKTRVSKWQMRIYNPTSNCMKQEIKNGLNSGMLPIIRARVSGPKENVWTKEG